MSNNGKASVGDRYALETGDAGAARLYLLNKVYGPTTEKVLLEAGLASGMRVLDIGCGIGTVSCWMAEQVKPEGSVVGIDVSTAQLEIARQNALASGIKNVVFQEASAYETDLPRAEFDLIVCRFLLCHLTRPADALKEMYELLKPDGVLVCHDLDVESMFSDPPTAAYTRLIEILLAVGHERGVDYCIGRKLHRLLRDAGFAEPEVILPQPAFLRGPEKRFWEFTFLEASPAMIESGAASREEVGRLARELKAISEDETILVAQARTPLVWAKKI